MSYGEPLILHPAHAQALESLECPRKLRPKRLRDRRKKNAKDRRGQKK
jgi:hypothetical protein